jgi:hypothetical protein
MSLGEFSFRISSQVCVLFYSKDLYMNAIPELSMQYSKKCHSLHETDVIFLDRPRPQSTANLDFLLLAMRAIGIRHSITHHFTAQLELDMKAAGVTYNVAECPPSMVNKYGNHGGTLPAPMRILEEHNTSFATSRQSPSMTDVIEDLTGANIAAGFRKDDQELHPFGGQPHSVPYFISDMHRREKELSTDQNTKVSNGGGAESTPNFKSQIHGLPVATDTLCPFEQNFSVPTGDTPSSDSSSSNKMQDTANTTPPDMNMKSYPYRHIDPSNHGAKQYGIFQADLASFGDLPAGWDGQNEVSGFGSGDMGGNGTQNDFSGFDNNSQPGAEFHDFIGDGSWNAGHFQSETNPFAP